MLTAEASDKEAASLRFGWGVWRPQCLQFFNTPKWFLVFITLFSMIQGMTVGGITNVSLPSLEKRFQFENKHLGFIAGSNDISGIILVCLVSFYGQYGNKIKWLGYGALLTGFGCIAFALPHILIGDYDPVTRNSQSSQVSRPNKDLCYAKNISLSSFQELDCHSGYGTNWHYLMIFSVAQMLMGAGTTPLYSLAPAYIDENVHPKAAPIYLGVFFASAIIGPGLGFIVGGAMLSIYVDVKLPDGVFLTPNDSRWIGAWWMGYFIGGCALLFSSIGVFAFPAQFPGSTEMRDKVIQEGNLPKRNEKIKGKLKDIWPATVNLLKNPTYMFNTAGITVGSMWGIGVVTFIAKILTLKFGVNAVMSGIILGSALIPSCAGGMLLGGYLVRRFNLKESCKLSAKYCLILRLIGLFGSLMWLIPGCAETKMAGVTVPYHNSSLLHTGIVATSLTATCNMHCDCKIAVRNPVCGTDNIEYFSPCQAGCKTTLSRGVYTNCSCILPRFNTTESRATSGVCDKGPGCKNLWYFAASFLIVIVVVFLSGIPSKTVVLRSVPDNQRAYALGFQFIFQRALGFLPGPMIFGAFFDSLCVLWGTSCGRRGSCQLYDIDEFSKRLAGVGILFSLVSSVFLFLSWWFYKPIIEDPECVSDSPDDAEQKVLLAIETTV